MSDTQLDILMRLGITGIVSFATNYYYQSNNISMLVLSVNLLLGGLIQTGVAIYKHMTVIVDEIKQTEPHRQVLSVPGSKMHHIIWAQYLNDDDVPILFQELIDGKYDFPIAIYDDANDAFYAYHKIDAHLSEEDTNYLLTSDQELNLFIESVVIEEGDSLESWYQREHKKGNATYAAPCGGWPERNMLTKMKPLGDNNSV